MQRIIRGSAEFFVAALAGLVACSSAPAQLKISQVDGTGPSQGTWTGTNTNFVEIHNAGSTDADLTGYAVQVGAFFSSGGGTTTWNVSPFPNGFIIPAGKYALVQIGLPGGISTPIRPYSPGDPTSTKGYSIHPDLAVAVGGGSGGLGSGGGKVALTSTATPLTGNCPLPNAAVVDFVGYGSFSLPVGSCAEGTVAPAFSTLRTDGKSLYRGCLGDTDTNDNSADFVLALSSPRNLSSPANMPSMLAVGFPSEANAVSVMQTMPVLITATASSSCGGPPPTGVQFTVDLTLVGGSSTQTMYDDGTHGDVTAGDGVFSVSYAVPDTVLPAPSGVTINRPWLVPIVGTDALGRTASTYATFFVTIAPTGACCMHGQETTVRTSASCAAAGGTYLGDGSSPFSQRGTVYTTGNTTLIPDMTGTTPGVGSETLSISDPTIVHELVVNVVANHSFQGDLIATLTHGATTVPLFSRCGLIGANAVGYGANLSAFNTLTFFNGGSSYWNAVYGGGKDTDYVVHSGYYAPSGAQDASASFAPFIGAPITGNWTLTVSDNTNMNTGFFSWSLEINPTGATCCKADYNGDGRVTVQDIFDFLGGWFAGNPRADFNGNGSVTVQDIFSFLSAWFAGC